MDGPSPATAGRSPATAARRRPLGLGGRKGVAVAFDESLLRRLAPGPLVRRRTGLMLLVPRERALGWHDEEETISVRI